MVLSRLTKITGPGVATDTNWVGNNADFTGITTTATSFNIGVTTIHSNLIEAHNIKSTGIITATGGSFSGNVTAVDGTFSGNVSIAGTLTYEDVTNIDAVGIITAPALDVDDFLDVGSNIKLGNAGVITATSFVGSGAALTGIDATAIKDSGGNVKIQAQASGAIHSGVSTFQDIDVDGHTNLDNVSVAGIITSAVNVHTPYVYMSGTAPGVAFNDTDHENDFTIGLQAGIWKLRDVDGGVDRYQVNSSGQHNLIGSVQINGGNVSIVKDLDVDGHTNLDNVSIAGVTTITGSGNALEIVGGLVRSRNTASARFVANNGSAEGYFGWSSGVLTVGQAAATLSLEATGSNHIQLKTNGNEQVRINSSGHMGLGVTPNTNWPTNADFKALQIGTGACVFGRGSGDEDRGGIAVNWYSTGSANKYIGNGNAARIYLADGNIYFANAGANSSGANAAMTITDRMTINVNGDIGVNCTPLGSDPFKLDVTGTSFNVARFTRSGGAAGVRIEGNGATEAVYLSLKTLNTTANSGCVIEGVDADGNGTSWIKLYTENNSTNAGAISLHTRPAGGSTTERFRIDSSGNVTKPYQPSFTARSTGTWSHGSSTGYLDIDINMVEEFDVGGNYNGQIFTAPVAGKYFFSYTFQYKCTSGYLVVFLQKGVSGSYNSYGRMHVYPPQQSTVYTGPGIIGIIDLAAGNTVKPVAEVNYAGNQVANVNFSGYLLG